MFKKVVVGICGGTDSAVAAFLLKSKGFDVTGVFMKSVDISDETDTCINEKDCEHAQLVCDKLKIPLIHVDFIREYWNNNGRSLIKKLENDSLLDLHILCNKDIKFNKLLQFARTELQADTIATGHYVRTSFGPYLEHFQPDANVHLLTAQNISNDDTYNLSQVPQDVLRYCMFPLGEHLKSNVKQIAQQAKLDVLVNKNDSMSICYFGKQNQKDLVSKYIPDKPGDIINFENGQIVGKHMGLHHWDIGEEYKTPSNEDSYIIYKKDVETNDILVIQRTHHSVLCSHFIITETPYWISMKPPEFDTYCGLLHCDVRLKSGSQSVRTAIHHLSDGLLIQIKQSAKTITVGQFAVMYKAEECLGSASVLYRSSLFYPSNHKADVEQLQTSSKHEKKTVDANIQCIL